MTSIEIKRAGLLSWVQHFTPPALSSQQRCRILAKGVQTERNYAEMLVLRKTKTFWSLQLGLFGSADLQRTVLVM